MNGKLDDEVVEKLIYAGLADGLYVSPVTGWEVGLLARAKAGRKAAVACDLDPLTWFSRLMGQAVISVAPLTGEIGIKSSFLPGTLHGDSADRLLIGDGA